MDKIKFGTGGWRAIIADDFTKENIKRVVYALCELLIEQGNERTICIGYDRRFLSREAAHWVAETAAASGVTCLVLKSAAPTPMIMFTVREYNLPFGMAVTASHNPAIYNGIKVFTEGGRDASEETTDRLEQLIMSHDGPIQTTPYDEGLKRGIIKEIDPSNEYIDAILALVDVDAIRKGSYRIALDPMYGVSRTSLRTLLSIARCDVEVIHERHDTLFGGRLPTPNSDTLRALTDFVTENGFDLGIATDGDADRIGVIDDKAVFVHPNRLMVLLYYYLLKYRGWRGSVVRNNSTTHLLDEVAASFNEKCFEVPVGFKHVSAAMEREDALIGGESSGGLTVRGHIRGKDGIYAAALLVEMLAVTGKKLSELYREITERYGERFCVDAEIRLTEENKRALADVLFEQKLLPSFTQEIESVSYEDGCKVRFKDGGWVIARFSGTEPLLRLCAEMRTEEDAKDCVRIYRDFLGA